MTDVEQELVIEALSVAAGELERKTRKGGSASHAERAAAMRSYRTKLCRAREGRRPLAQHGPAPRRCSTDIVDLNGECIACGAAQGETCRERQARRANAR